MQSGLDTNHQDTIVALATPFGRSAIAVIRLSGSDSLSICNSIFKGANLASQASHTIHYGYILDENKIEVDEVMLSLFLAPRSFTTENSVEIACHGSTFIAEKIISLLIAQGARLAKPGEFTMRAFMNGRIDLSQAEAVADLIASSTEASVQIALQQMRGGFSSKIKFLREELVNLASLLELELDFSEEDVEFADRKKIIETVLALQSQIEPLIESFKLGNVIKNGIPTAIIGKPNAGKSTLLNALLNEERAIVSEIAGTTRDAIEEVITLKGIQFRIIDTAGLRETNDKIESIGISKTKEKIKLASLLLYLFDCKDVTIEEVEKSISECQRNDLAIILCPSKIDCLSESEWNYFQEKLSYFNLPIVGISAKTNLNIDLLKSEMLRISNLRSIDTNETIVSNQRHYQALLQSKYSLESVLKNIASQNTTDLLAFELKDSLNCLGEITGEVTNDEILGNIFSKFCIGK